MRGIPTSGILIFILILLIVEGLAFAGITQLVKDRKTKKKVSFIYWLSAILFFTVWLIAFLNPEKLRQTTNYQFFYFVIDLTILNIIPKFIIAVFTLVAIPFRLFRAKFASRAIVLSGTILSLGMLLSIGYGIVLGRKSIRQEQVELMLPDMPVALNGLKIVQISDIHLGSFEDDRFMKRCTEVINQIDADLILFTGDIVNNYNQEMTGFEDELTGMKARYGKFAILGNHDYGDYSKWNSQQDKLENQEIIHKELINAGFDLLLNQFSKVSIRDTSFYIIGVENWGHKPFPQYARLDSAMAEVPVDAFKILMTHDPAHWLDKVIGKTTIPLTLSGHTHGGQFAVKIGGMEFSPMYLIQKTWGGLYQQNNQYLYVNRGIGCVGFLGRIDMAPEITILTLRSE